MGNTVCPICGKDSPHHHPQDEIDEYHDQAIASDAEIEAAALAVDIEYAMPKPEWRKALGAAFAVRATVADSSRAASPREGREPTAFTASWGDGGPLAVPRPSAPREEKNDFTKAYFARDPMADLIMSLRNAGITVGAACHHDADEAVTRMRDLSLRLWNTWNDKIIEARGEAGHLMAQVQEAESQLAALRSSPPPTEDTVEKESRIRYQDIVYAVLVRLERLTGDRNTESTKEATLALLEKALSRPALDEAVREHAETILRNLEAGAKPERDPQIPQITLYRTGCERWAETLSALLSLVRDPTEAK